ncbi:A/G-specific adenine glycosylase [Pseudopedobacter saltans DSM 12145]|uniref:Adenine DNA glycosylase n=1 Tax=Pseudopedobacter saltans (strain ATCC 51119 / DSM 12145 / JCM 21818 / CCUG 39354 / LMG 10337 / NBRC 100064 / NCIMB 13643) TaxID=762903 RepID=F0SAP5_PSESL|nr:A/G-specific adenine glycosylase [Pseudopedobacter saltans]ADY53666.1 A/G-specific adenine glycosylase [Pseudopedobacter saltans DSM 12145]
MNFSDELIKWYRINKRDLPWRNTSDPYHIWLSEIILQQTRVEQGMPYYFRFAENFPDVKSFAEASEDQILHYWQGLGYYSRGRNMLKTARKVMEEHRGIFPNNYAQLIKLVGIGEYTAAAISSFSSNEAKAVVDGNVYRLLARHFGIDTPINTTQGKKQFQELANSLLNEKNAGEHNQAIIEFGALQCKPKNPNCDICPLNISCHAFQNNLVSELPVKNKNLKIKERHFYYFIVIKDNKILVKRRGESDIWAGLHDFPMIESPTPLTFDNLAETIEFKNLIPEQSKISSVSNSIKHILTHQRLFGTFIEVSDLNTEFIKENNWFWVNVKQLDKLAKPKLIFAFLKNFYKLNEI